MNNYIDMEIERDRSIYPRGMKHYSKETVLENTLFDCRFLAHRVKMILKGDDDGKEKNKSYGA